MQAKAVPDDIFEAEAEVLESATGFIEKLKAVPTKWSRASSLAETLDVLHAIEVRDDVMQTVQAIRRSGTFGVFIDHRAQ